MNKLSYSDLEKHYSEAKAAVPHFKKLLEMTAIGKGICNNPDAITTIAAEEECLKKILQMFEASLIFLPRMIGCPNDVTIEEKANFVKLMVEGREAMENRPIGKIFKGEIPDPCGIFPIMEASRKSMGREETFRPRHSENN